MSQANLKLLGLAALFFGGFFLLSALGGALLFAMPVLVISVALLSYRVRCHRCGWSLIKRGIFVFPYAPKSCPSCGEKVA